MCLCASLSRRRRGPAGLRDLFCFCRNCGLYTLRSELSVRARQGWYHYPRCALHVLEMTDGRLSKRLTCRFLRSGEQRPLRSAYFFRIYRIFCRKIQLQPLLRYGTINPRNWKNFRTIMPLNSRLQLQVPHRGHAPNNRKEVLSHEETHLLGSGGSPAAEPCRLRGKLRSQSIRFLRRFFIFSRSRPAGCLLPRHHGGGSSGSLWGRRGPHRLHRGVPGRLPGAAGNGGFRPQLGLGLR